MSNSSSILPPSLDLPPHLSAHKYFFVCTLTVAAWDTLVLSPRSYRLLRTKEWPLLKIVFHFLRVFMPIEFTIVGVAFFDTKWSLEVSVSDISGSCFSVALSASIAERCMNSCRPF